MVKFLINNFKSFIASRKVRISGQVIFICMCLLFLTRRFSNNWLRTKFVLSDLEWPLFASSFSLLAVTFLFLPVGMVVFRIGSQQKIKYLQSAHAYFVSQLSKYLPGGLWVYPSRIFILKTLGFDLGLSSIALMFETLTIVSSVFIVSILFLGLTNTSTVLSGSITLVILIGCIITVTSFLILPRLAQRFIPASFFKSQTFVQFANIPVLVRVKNFFWASALYSIMWIMAGISFYLLLLAINPRFGTDLMIFSIGVFSLSWLIGFLSFFSPGGIGIRESAIVLLLGTVISEPYPLIAALISRTCWLLLELLFFIFALLIARKKYTA